MEKRSEEEREGKGGDFSTASSFYWSCVRPWTS